ncbi:hypothetical protein EVAR_30008_1 [Eumeta japonica]|uniref:Uncharacterized protein n=1 Tax=Eumeta variegata TaxID=151549 RepID=A0A4C1VX12_EUMVA|nr:hypothetical protein EVAR_30008_1 [Eumeta japonica]
MNLSLADAGAYIRLWRTDGRRWLRWESSSSQRRPVEANSKAPGEAPTLIYSELIINSLRFVPTSALCGAARASKPPSSNFAHITPQQRKPPTIICEARGQQSRQLQQHRDRYVACNALCTTRGAVGCGLLIATNVRSQIQAER